MGQTAEELAYHFDIARKEMDAFAVRSHQRVVQAQKAGYFPYITTVYNNLGEAYSTDTGVRPETSKEKLAKLRPYFDKHYGLVTAGNSSQITDGACVLLLASASAVKRFNLPVMGRLIDCHWAGLAPINMGLGPVHASIPLMQRHGLHINDIDYWEINEAFAAQVLACIKAFADPDYCSAHFGGLDGALGQLDPDKVNVDGGAIAMGHPVGASGARIILQLLHVLTRQNAKRGMASICIGGGQGGAMLIERTHKRLSNMSEQNYRHWRCEIDSQNIASVYFDMADSHVNIFNAQTLSELNDIIIGLIEQKPSALVIASAKPDSFIMGADIEAIARVQDEEQAYQLVLKGRSVFDRIAALPFTTVVMINGFCLGGGLELALACDYRVVCNNTMTKLALPEIKLGICPGWGGTVRLPRLIGLFPAMDMILTGRFIHPNQAKKIGLADVIVPKRQLQRAALATALHPPKKQQVPWYLAILNNTWLRPKLGRMLTKKIAAKVREAHYPAPFKIIDNWIQYGVDQSAFGAESKTISQLMMTDTCRNLLRVYHLREQLKSFTKRDVDPITHVHVIGAGTMGADIAMVCALNGMRVTLQDTNCDIVAKAMGRAQIFFQKKMQATPLGASSNG